MQTEKRVLFVGLLGLLMGCTDPGALELQTCKLNECLGDISEAVTHCEAASRKGAWWGGAKREAEERLGELRPKLRALEQGSG